MLGGWCRLVGRSRVGWSDLVSSIAMAFKQSVLNFGLEHHLESHGTSDSTLASNHVGSGLQPRVDISLSQRRPGIRCGDAFCDTS